MLYSKEVISIHNTEKEVFLYLKKTRNHSYRITANKISMTLPSVYKNPETIDKHKNELLEKIKTVLIAQPKWVNTKHILDLPRLTIMNDEYTLIRKEEGICKAELVVNQKKIYLPFLLTDNDKSRLSKLIIQAYHKKIDARVRYINAITIAKTITHVTIKNNQSTWGLCSSRGEITLSLHTLFAPLWVIDYIIVHELCHLVHHDHSPRFWSLVECFYPKYKLAKKFLKEKGIGLAY